MEAAIGVDRQITKLITGNVTYVFSQGIHQYFTDNLSAAAEFPLANAQSDTYPTAAPARPATNNLQYQSGGFYRENQIMVTVRPPIRKFSLFTSYTYSNAQGDTSGVGSVPSVSSDPGLDYGRTSFDIHQPRHDVRELHAALGGFGVAHVGGELGNAVQHHDRQRPDGKQPVQWAAHECGKLL